VCKNLKSFHVIFKVIKVPKQAKSRRVHVHRFSTLFEQGQVNTVKIISVNGQGRRWSDRQVRTVDSVQLPFSNFFKPEIS